MSETASAKSAPNLNKLSQLQMLEDNPNPALPGKYADVTVTFSGTPNTEGAVAHNLGWVPTGYIVIGLDRAGKVYTSGGTGATAWTTSNIYLKCDTASVVAKIRVF